MTGSEKQITWAADIKAKTLQAVESNKQGDAKTEAPAYDALTAQLEAIEESKWWIDHRHMIATLAQPEEFAKITRKEVWVAANEGRF